MPIIANTTSSNTFSAVRAQLNSVTKRMNQFAVNESMLYANTVYANVAFTAKGTATVTGLFTASGRATVGTNLSVTGNTTIAGLKANNSLGTAGYVLKTNGTAAYWDAAGGAGAVGGGTDKAFYENDITITTNYTITTNKNAMSAGPITVNSGVTVTVPSGSVWTIV